MIVFLFLVWRVIDFLVLIFFEGALPKKPIPFQEILENYPVADFLKKLAYFDGVHYLIISEKGYYEYQQAFFPLFPILIRLLTYLTKNSLIAGIIISNLFFLLSWFFFLGYLNNIFRNQRKNLFEIMITFLVFPTSFFFGTVYTEGVFFFLLAGSLYFLRKQNYWLVGLFSFLASLNRLIGLFLVIFWIIHFLERKKEFPNKGFSLIYFLTLSPVFGLLSYSFYLCQTTGNPLMFFSAQSAFGRSTESLILLPQVIWRYLKIFFTAKMNYEYFLAAFEFAIFVLFFFILLLDLKNLVVFRKKIIAFKNKDLLAMNLFSWVNLVVPTLTGTLSAIPRYSLFSLSAFVYLSNLKNKLLKKIIWLIFFVFHLLFLVFFSHGYFVS
ncbi:MAG: hypothetical protein NZL96_03810 [Patescibacteria group bacterium]|nr:hypothetical protein [Patescibacteria group bacterium]